MSIEKRKCEEYFELSSPVEQKDDMVHLGLEDLS